MTPPLSEKWRLEISATAFSYPLIADGRVFVTVARGGLEGTELTALDAATGAELWERALQTSFPVSSATYGHGHQAAIGCEKVQLPPISSPARLEPAFR